MQSLKQSSTVNVSSFLQSLFHRYFHCFQGKFFQGEILFQLYSFYLDFPGQKDSTVNDSLMSRLSMHFIQENLKIWGYYMNCWRSFCLFVLFCLFLPFPSRVLFKSKGVSCGSYCHGCHGNILTELHNCRWVENLQSVNSDLTISLNRSSPLNHNQKLST